jgi:hypothetical protein
MIPSAPSSIGLLNGHLRLHRQVAREYEELKRDHAPLHSAATFDSRQAYADAKAGFITRVTERALAEGLPREL